MVALVMTWYLYDRDAWRGVKFRGVRNEKIPHKFSFSDGGACIMSEV